MSNFKVFIGIDQTGAVKQNGFPKPLSLTLIDARKKPEKIFAGISLPSLNKDSLLKVIRDHLPKYREEKVLICIDTVFGLPEALKTNPSTLFQRIKNYEFEDKPYGALTAYQFFRQFLADGPLPKRRVEQIVKANSVFLMKPFQRNIGCGSYRIMKELAQEPQWFSLWPFEKTILRFTVAEGYPTYFWKHLLGNQTRSLQFLQTRFPELHFSNMDEADSFVLAYGAMHSTAQITNLERPKIAQREGWILGVPFA